ncbi:MAG TPA: right-handed parallel beta-helix repeat-containing protein [Candidatus Paceibacterota bacterium]|nr:right-handed parallel beta-helix repeat-containing protein [Verrucomicrobiota bacterium]HSA11970.1 right-handed parallel beta-helix repeat-containing protein [Candidatus Paceibacterota bacterium]
MFAALQGSAATLLVTNSSVSGPGSLQQAILDANAANGLDTIIFHIPGTGVRTIAPTSALPSIIDPVVIDGASQPGFAGTPLIQITGTTAGTGSHGLHLLSGNSTIRGLAINRFSGAGIFIEGPGGTNLIQGNFIGTDPTGNLGQGNGASPPTFGGVFVFGSSGNWIGGSVATNRNLISANTGSGIYLYNCSSNVVQGNLIGTTVAGTSALGNSTNGISIYNASGNQIGGTSAATRNIISGNGASGVSIYGPSAMNNTVQGNYIGTQVNGGLALSNAADGITLNGTRANTIGGTNLGAGNLISGNGQVGLFLRGTGAYYNLVQGNYVGTDTSGRLPLGNGFSGITILGCTSNLIGGLTAGARNVVSANRLSGVYITTSANANLVQGNYVGVDATGTNALGNGANGISIESANSNTVGGINAGARNVISGNTGHGIEIYPATAATNTIQGNYIGPDVRGLSALSWGPSVWSNSCGIYIVSPGNLIGGTASGAGNVISGNTNNGVSLVGNNAVGNLIQGNLIGTTADGKAGLMNVWAGVGISGAPGNLVGGTTPGAGNLISANAVVRGDAGIYLIGAGATRNAIQGNKIGTDITGTLPLGNTHEGIYVENAPSNTIGGVIAGAGNLISGNKTTGILLYNAPGTVIQGNLIGTKVDGFSPLGNTWHSLDCEIGTRNTTIGGTGGAGNTIAFAKAYTGVRIRNSSTNNAILGNAIFSNNALGIDLGNLAGINGINFCGGSSTSAANLSNNCPVLVKALSGSGTEIHGTLNSRPNKTYLLQFFANFSCDPTGVGEGQFYLGEKSVITDANCTNSFVATLPTPMPPGYTFVTATATDSTGNTSEFSACIGVSVAPEPPILSIASLLSSGQVALAWTNTPGFVLEQTDTLSPPIPWAIVTNNPVLINGQYVVTVSTTTSNRFFRLSY